MKRDVQRAKNDLSAEDLHTVNDAVSRTLSELALGLKRFAVTADHKEDNPPHG